MNPVFASGAAASSVQLTALALTSSKRLLVLLSSIKYFPPRIEKLRELAHVLSELFLLFQNVEDGLFALGADVEKLRLPGPEAILELCIQDLNVLEDIVKRWQATSPAKGVKRVEESIRLDDLCLKLVES